MDPIKPKAMTNNTFLIFIVDDDPVFLEILQSQLKQKKHLFRYNYEVKVFPVGELCVEEIYLDPDIVILDYNLNTKYHDANNGNEILATIKAYCKDTEIIMLSAQDDPEVVARLLTQGAYTYIVKSESVFFRIQSAIADIFSSIIFNQKQKRLRKRKKILHAAVVVTLIIETTYIMYSLA